MSRTGNITFFTEHSGQRVEDLIRASFRLMGAGTVTYLWRSVGPDRGWDEFQGSIALDREERPMVDDDSDSTELVGRDVAVDEVARLYLSGTSLRTLMPPTELGLALWEAIKDAVPEAVRGDFAPAEPGIVVGEHDIFECAEHEEGHLFGRAFFSFSLFGYGTPNDWRKFREVVFRVPAIVKLQSDIESFAGPVKRCVYWSV